MWKEWKMLKMPEIYAAFNVHFLWTGNESWTFCEYHHKTICAVASEEVGELGGPMHDPTKTIALGFR
jgi:hypothetical protein